MTFKIEHANGRYIDTREITSVLELENISKEFDNYQLVIDFDDKTIIIYDDFLE